jgi:putative nucleotidyltransferase with HDIG domain
MKAEALKILQTLRDNGFTALFVGGCVRDMVMGREPGDYDIVTDASPQDVMKLFKRTVPVGVQFGIIIVVLKGVKYEVAQFRSTLKDVERLKEDALHRDFTMNGMFYDPTTNEIFDYVGGQGDIHNKLICAIENPYARFEEDRLRMMRAVRFASAYDYQIDPATFEAMSRLAPQIQTVSVERTREELVKILTTPHPDRGIRLLDEAHLLAPILPEVAVMKGVQQPTEFHPEGDVFTHTLLMLHQMSASATNGHKRRKVTPELAMGVLLHDVGKPNTYTETDRIRFHEHEKIGAAMAEQICLRLKFSTKATEKIVTLIKEHVKFFQAEQMRTSTLKRFLRQEHIRDLLELHRLDCLSSKRSLRTYQFCQAKLQEFKQEPVQLPRLISGDDLIELGFTPGPVFKQVLEYIEDAQLDGTISTKRDALNLVQEIQETLRNVEC